MNKPKPRIPEIGEYVRGVGTLVGIQEVPPKPVLPGVDYIFESITARCDILHGTEILKEISILWDFYGKATSVETSIDEAKAYAAKKKIGPDSDLEVVVTKVVEQLRKRPEQSENFYDKKFLKFEPIKWGASHDVLDPVETVVWSSRNTMPG